MTSLLVAIGIIFGILLLIVIVVFIAEFNILGILLNLALAVGGLGLVIDGVSRSSIGGGVELVIGLLIGLIGGLNLHSIYTDITRRWKK